MLPPGDLCRELQRGLIDTDAFFPVHSIQSDLLLSVYYFIIDLFHLKLVIM